MNSKETLVVGGVNSSETHVDLGCILQAMEVTACLLLIVPVCVKIPCV